MKKINRKILLLITLSAGMLIACERSGDVSSYIDSSGSPISQNESKDNPSIGFSNTISESIVYNDSSKQQSNSSGTPVTSSATPSSSSAQTSTSSTPKTYEGWDIDTTLRGSAFRNKLATLINKKQSNTTSYDNCLYVGARAAAVGNDGRFVPFYHTTDTLTKVGSCNREHTWPNSRGSGKSGPGADPFMIRPTLSSENNDRSNYFYGLNGKSNKEWDPASCGFTGARGESARVIFYTATKYGSSYGFSLTNNPEDSTSLKTMGRLDRMIVWNKMYPVTDMERQINDYLESQGYGRNPFVDYPELVDYIWDKNGILTNNSNYYSVSGISYEMVMSKCIYIEGNSKLY